MAQHTTEELEELPDLAGSQDGELKIDGDEDGLRVWLSYHPKRVTYERLVGGRWRTCDSEGNLS